VILSRAGRHSEESIIPKGRRTTARGRARDGKPARPERPRRAPGIRIDEVEDGCIVYQRARDRVHYLNATAALVLELCTGANSREEIVELVQLATGPGARQRKVIEGLVAHLRTEGLIDLPR
jgi:hypothetical protein